MAVMKLTANVSGMKKKMSKTRQQVDIKAFQLMEELGEQGKRFARNIAPYDTGRTASMIMKRVDRTRTGAKLQIIAKNPTVGGKHTRNKNGANRKRGNFNLVKYMHLNPTYFNKDPQFLFTTKEYLRKVGKAAAKNKFKLNI